MQSYEPGLNKATIAVPKSLARWTPIWPQRTVLIATLPPREAHGRASADYYPGNCRRIIRTPTAPPDSAFWSKIMPLQSRLSASSPVSVLPLALNLLPRYTLPVLAFHSGGISWLTDVAVQVAGVAKKRHRQRRNLGPKIARSKGFEHSRFLVSRLA